MKTSMKGNDMTELAVADEWFFYDPDTGYIHWKNKPCRNIRVGDHAGFFWNEAKGATQYVRVQIKKRMFMAHRIATCCMTGRHIPNNHEIDHINGVGTDNRWANLRLVTHTENGRNQPRPRHNTSGAIGVTYHKLTSKWCAQIVVNKRNHHLGLFADKADAISAHALAMKKFGFHPNHGRPSNV